MAFIMKEMFVKRFKRLMVTCFSSQNAPGEAFHTFFFKLQQIIPLEK